jgi:hypothetical protein
MISIKTMKQIATSRVIPSFRALSAVELERSRITAGRAQIQVSESRRRWLNGAYLRRLEH